jgi:adenylate kinase
MNIIMIGIQGSGKGTQAGRLREKYGWEHVNVGDAFRMNIVEKTQLGVAAKSFIDKGELVPDKYVYGIVEDALNKASGGFILDGFPRNMKQADFLIKKFKIDHVVIFDLEDEIAVKRLTHRRLCQDCKTDYNLKSNKPKVQGICDKCGGKLMIRDDDHLEAINKRIEKFHEETKQVIDYFKEKGHIVYIHADKTPDAIFEEIEQKIF